jgi:hypothetical protein
MKDQLSCSKCDFRAPDKATRCPQCGGWIRRAQRIRRLGVVMIFIGIVLVGMMGTITVLLAPMMLSAGTSTSGAKFEGTPEQGLLILGLFGLIIVFGLVAIAAGVFQIVTGRRSIWIVILVIGLALVLYVMATAVRTALKRASVESQLPRAGATDVPGVWLGVRKQTGPAKARVVSLFDQIIDLSQQS